MLPYSHKPQVLRLHTLQKTERNRFISNYNFALTELLSPSINRIISNSKLLKGLLSTIPDVYYSLVTINLCRRRLGEEYTYIAMYKQKHYDEQGVLLNKKTRLLLFLLQIISRNLMLPFFSKVMEDRGESFQISERGNDISSQMNLKDKLISIAIQIRQILVKAVGNAEEIMSNAEWLILMVFMLDWNKYFNLLETILGIRYAYTFKNNQTKEVSYAIQGYLLLATFIVKIVKHIYGFLKDRKSNSSARAKPPPAMPQNIKPSDKFLKKEKALCRICYDDLKLRSSTKCGHIFCWSCIIKTLEISPECPVCRNGCQPQQVVQLRNI